MANFIVSISWVKNLFRTIKIMCLIKLHMIVKLMPGIVAAPHLQVLGRRLLRESALS
jgi:hypothetical protein